MENIIPPEIINESTLLKKRGRPIKNANDKMSTEQKQQYFKNYWNKNKEAYNTRIMCQCGKNIRTGHQKTHLKTDWHISTVEKLTK